MQNQLLKLGDMHFVPGTGAGSLDPLIRLYVGWARNFVILLDADGEGEAQKNRFSNLFGALVKERIFTLADLNPAWSKRGMERMFTDADSLTIQRTGFPGTTVFHKTHFARALQELTLTKRSVALKDTTIVDFTLLFNALHVKLEAARIKF